MYLSLFVILILTAFLTIVYAGLLFYLKKGLSALSKQPLSDDYPFVSVIVSAHNEAHHLPQCIVHLQAQDYPRDRVEFILVDDRSTDGTAAILKEAAIRDKRFQTFSIRERIPEIAPKKRAIDRAIHQAKGEIILLTDADGRPAPEWVRSMMRYFSKNTQMVIGYAPYTVIPENHHIKRLLALEYLSHAAVAAATCGLGYPVTCVGTNMAYRKSLYFEVGGFGPYKSFISGDDDLFLTHVREFRRYTIQYATDAHCQVFNNPPRLWSRFLHQRMRYASKGLKYPLKVSAALITYFMFNVSVFLLPLAALFNGNFLIPALAILALKAGSEFIFMNRAATVLHDRRNLLYFPFAFFLHPPYVLMFGILGQFNYFRWAESQSESGIQQEVIEQAEEL